MRAMISAYNSEALTCEGDEDRLDKDPTRISWSRGLINDAARGRRHEFRPERIYRASYRPFTAQYGYFDRPFNDMVYRLEEIFPTPAHENYGFGVIAPHPHASFAVLMQDSLPDVATYTYTAQFFPRWTYEKVEDDTALFLPPVEGPVINGYRRVDNITDEILAIYQSAFGPQVSKDDIFYYVYAVLHSPQYRNTFAADLKRMLPRIPLAASRNDFGTFAETGRRLADLHMNYESVDPYPLHESTHPFGVDDGDLYRVQKMRWQDKQTKKAIVYNTHLTLSDIPAEANEYMLGSRSGLEWLIDRYRVRTDKDSGIVNDPNDWCREHDDPRYIIDLVKRVTRVSVETMRIIRSLPELPL